MPNPKPPKHIAIIMDGNNRYAKREGLPTGGGHLAGKDSLDPIVEYCAKVGVGVLTVFAFSSENWARPPHEVALLMALLKQTIIEQLPKLSANQIRLRFIGDRGVLSKELQALMASAERETAHFDKMTLVIAVSYGGKWDIVESAKSLINKVKNGEIGIDEIDETAFTAGVSLGDCPPVDMLVRTGGDYRISNFLLWQSAYAELFFTNTLWPDFTPDELGAMMADFANRERRFGKTSEQVAKGNL